MKEMTEEYGTVKCIQSRKNRYGSSINQTMIHYTDKQEAKTAIVKVNKYRGWTAEM